MAGSATVVPTPPRRSYPAFLGGSIRSILSDPQISGRADVWLPIDLGAAFCFLITA